MRLGKELSDMRERQEKIKASLRGTASGTTEQQQPTRSRKMGNGATGPAKPAMGDGVPPTAKTGLSAYITHHVTRAQVTRG
jgi:hypothetical protein